MNLNISLNSTTTAPVALQWNLTYSTTDFTSAIVTTGLAASTAGKSVFCDNAPGSSMCILSGINTNTVSNGVIATVTLTISPSTTHTSSSISLSNEAAASSQGTALTIAATGSTVTITQPVQPTYSISGTISPTAGGGGATVTLSGGATATTTANSSGVYTFSGLSNGSYTVTPKNTGYTFSPTSRSVTISGANATGENFTAAAVTNAWSISGTISPTAGGSGATVALGGASTATTTANSSGNYTFTGLSNGSYTVTPSKSGYVMSPGSKTVSISGANVTAVNFTATATATTWSISGTISPTLGGSGATVTLSGAASATTTANSSGAFTFSGLSNGSYTVTPKNSGYTFSPASLSVTVSGKNVTGVNFTAAAGTWSISGTITPTTGGNGATVTLSGAASATTTANSSGNYTFSGLLNGTYTVTPTHSGYTIAPASRSVTVSGANVTAVNFTATAVASTWSISGTISPTAGGSGATVTLSGAASMTTTANSSGSYTFTNLPAGTYTVTPTHSGYTFSPPSQSVKVTGANVTGVNFTATAVASTWSVSGTITPAANGSGATVKLSGAAGATTTADASGNFKFSGVTNGAYTITPSKSGYNFTPASQAVNVNGANVASVNFTAKSNVSTAPSVVSVSPSSGSGSSQKFAFTFSDNNGASDIVAGQVDFGSVLGAANSCYIYYSRGANAIYLANDAGSWQAPLTIGVNSTLSNSQCSINAASSSVSTSGNTLTLNLALSFTSTYDGIKNIYSLVSNQTENSGWGLFGTWDVVAAPTPDFSLRLSPSSQTVSAGHGTSYTVTVTGTNGFSGAVNFGISGLPSGATTSFSPGSVTGSGSTTLNVTTPASAASGTYTLTVTGTSGGTAHTATASLGVTPATSTSPPSVVSVTPDSGSGSTQTFAFTFTDSAGATDILSAQIDFGSVLASTGSCYVYYTRPANALYLANNVGTWLTPLTIGGSGTLSNSQCAINPATSSVSVSGNSLTLHLPITFTSSFIGSKNIYMLATNAIGSSSWGLFGSWTVTSASGGATPDFSLSASPSSQTVTAGSSKSYSITATAKNGFTGVINLAVSGLPAGATSILNPPSLSGSGTSTLTVNTTLGVAAGTSTLTVTGTSGALQHSATASLTVSGESDQPPMPVTVTPNGSTGFTDTFEFIFEDAQGVSDISSTQIDIGGALAASSSCYLYYSRSTNQLYLANDAGSWESPAQLGSPALLQNSQCSVNLGASSVSAAGNILALNLNLTFTASYAGAKNIYMLAAGSAVSSNWSLLGTWIVP